MRRGSGRALVLAAAAATVLTGAAAPSPSADEICRKVLDSDPWGLGDAEVTARAVVKDESGRARQLAFRAVSLRYAPPLAKSIVRFTGPDDLAGVGFLLIQKSAGDDERWLYHPDRGRSRRIGGDTRSGASWECS